MFLFNSVLFTNNVEMMKINKRLRNISAKLCFFKMLILLKSGHCPLFSANFFTTVFEQMFYHVTIANICILKQSWFNILINFKGGHSFGGQTQVHSNIKEHIKKVEGQ